MELDNKTPCLAIAWQNLDSDGNENITTLVRGKFKFYPTAIKGVWELRFDSDQGELIGSDEFYSDDVEQSIRYESDFVGFKARTDVIINGIARSPDNQPSQDWQCGIKISDEDGSVRLEKWLQVTGKRYWRGDMFGWVLDKPEFTNQVPIRYENAFGGEAVKREADKEEQYFAVCYSNPIGTGLLHRKHPDKVVAAPQILSPDEPIDKFNPYKTCTPQGFGFYHRAWDLRLPLAGTYDEDWQENQWPLPPHDFDQAFNQAAHPDMIVDGYLKGNETIRLFNLLPNQKRHEFVLPKCYVLQRYVVSGKPVFLPHFLDTVIIDVESENHEDWAVYLSWRSLVANKNIDASSIMMLVPENLQS